MIDLIETVREEVELKGFSRLGILGTEKVMRSEFYGRLGQIKVVTPSPDLLANVHTAYVAMASSGLVTAPQREMLNAACTELIEDFGVDAVVLGGNDLALVYDEETSLFPTVDCAAIHSLKIVSASW